MPGRKFVARLHISWNPFYVFPPRADSQKSLVVYGDWYKWVISKFNGTSTPKGSYSAKTGVNCPTSLSRVHTKKWYGQMSARSKVRFQVVTDTNLSDIWWYIQYKQGSVSWFRRMCISNIMFFQVQEMWCLTVLGYFHWQNWKMTKIWKFYTWKNCRQSTHVYTI